MENGQLPMKCRQRLVGATGASARLSAHLEAIRLVIHLRGKYWNQRLPAELLGSGYHLVIISCPLHSSKTFCTARARSGAHL